MSSTIRLGGFCATSTGPQPLPAPHLFFQRLDYSKAHGWGFRHLVVICPWRFFWIGGWSSIRSENIRNPHDSWPMMFTNMVIWWSYYGHISNDQITDEKTIQSTKHCPLSPFNIPLSFSKHQTSSFFRRNLGVSTGVSLLFSPFHGLEVQRVAESLLSRCRLAHDDLRSAGSGWPRKGKSYNEDMRIYITLSWCVYIYT